MWISLSRMSAMAAHIFLVFIYNMGHYIVILFFLFYFTIGWTNLNVILPCTDQARVWHKPTIYNITRRVFCGVCLFVCMVLCLKRLLWPFTILKMYILIIYFTRMGHFTFYLAILWTRVGVQDGANLVYIITFGGVCLFVCSSEAPPTTARIFSFWFYVYF